MIETGIPKLDEYLGGGIPEGKSLLFCIDPTVEESNLGIHTLHHNLEKGRNCIYVVSKSSPKQVSKTFEEFGWRMEKYRDNLILLDGYSPLVGAPSEEKYVVLEPHDILSYEDAIQDAIEASPNRPIIVFDSLSNILDLCGERDALQGITRINDEIGKREGVGIYNFAAWPYKESILYRIKRIFDAIIDVTPIPGAMFVGQKYTPSKISWGGKTGKSVMFKVYKPGGIRIYIPKIIIIGPFQAGKTTFMRSLSTRFTSVDRLGATVSVEHGIVDYKGYRAELFGIPGQERFLPIMEKMGKTAFGIFLVIDATKPHELEHARQLLRNARNNIPCVIVANKQDLQGVLSEEEIRERLGVGEEVPIVKTIATQGTGVKEAFEVLVNKIMDSEVYVG